MLKDPAVLVSTGFGVGLVPGMPGTWGSVVALAVWYFALAGLAPWVTLLAAIATFGLGWVLSSHVGRRYDLGDDPSIVVDEIAGLWFALLWVPPEWWTALLAFVVFRVFDIAKPWPVSWADRSVKGGLGVMLDDLIAGLGACGVVHVAIFAFG